MSQMSLFTQVSSIPDRQITYRWPRVRVQLVRERTYSTAAPRITSPADAVSVAGRLLQDNHGLDQKETLWCIYLNTKNRVLGIEPVATGSSNSVTISLAEVFRGALAAGAVAIILAHNHPSGDLNPSPEDIAITRRIREAGVLLDVQILDHLIFNEERYISFKERGIGGPD